MTKQDSLMVRLSEAKIPWGEITEAVHIAAGDTELLPGFKFSDMPEYIKVSAVSKPDSDSFIRIECWLPVKDWNGDLAGLGNGGSAGALPAIMMAGPLRLGFATVTTDMGTSTGPDCGIEHPSVIKDFGHRATHLMTVAGKEIVRAWYGKAPSYSYFVGGSTGGQQGLSEAQRYPEDYDGILACAPAYDRVNLHLSFLRDWQALNAPGVEDFTAEDEKNLVARFLERYPEDGEKRGEDDFFYRPDRIRPVREDFEGLGFSEAQVDALCTIYEDLCEPETGVLVHEATLTPGSEASGMGLLHRQEKPGFEQGYFYLFRWILGSDFDFRNFDFAKDAETLHQALSADLDAVNPDLSAFKARGGKLLLVHGTADPIIGLRSSIRYFKEVQRRMGDTSDFFRLFLLPGMGHVAGGPGAQDYVYGLPACPKDEKHYGLLTLKAWCEENKAPDEIMPVHIEGDNVMMGFVPGVPVREIETKPFCAEMT